MGFDTTVRCHSHYAIEMVLLIGPILHSRRLPEGEEILQQPDAGGY